jgi:hypothetical protein
MRVRFLEIGFYADLILSGCVRYPNHHNQFSEPLPPASAPASAPAPAPAPAPSQPHLRPSAQQQAADDAAGDGDEPAPAFGPGKPALSKAQSMSESRNALQQFFHAPEAVDGPWETRLAASLRRPTAPISMLQSCAVRLRRIYLSLIGGVLSGWLVKLFVTHNLDPALIVPAFAAYLGAAFLLTWNHQEKEEDV